MKSFTVKDFILYNGPCFSCGSKISIDVSSSEIDSNNSNPNKKLENFIENNILDITLRVKYSYNLHLQISIKDNTFKVSDIDKFMDYLTHNKIYITSICNKCQCFIFSDSLQFSKSLVKPITILREILSVLSNDVHYMLNSCHSTNETQIVIINNDRPLEITSPLLPLYKFKTKERLINKLKTYALFI